MFFLLFYFIRNFAPLRTIELSGSNFRIKNWSLYVDLRFPPLNAGGLSKFAPSVFFEYGVRLRSRQLLIFVNIGHLSASSSDLNSMCSSICISPCVSSPCKNPRPEIKLFIAHVATAGKWYLRKMYILVARFIFDDSAMVVFKRRFSNCNGALVSRKNTFRWVLKQMFPCVSDRVVVDYDEFS